MYDPCCGSGGMFVQSEKFVQAHSDNRGNISVYGQESNAPQLERLNGGFAITYLLKFIFTIIQHII